MEESDLQGILQVLIDFHYCGLVAASVAVVGGCGTLAIALVHQDLLLEHTGEDGHHVPVLGPIVALHYQLMSSCDEGQAIIMVECL